MYKMQDSFILSFINDIMVDMVTVDYSNLNKRVKKLNDLINHKIYNYSFNGNIEELNKSLQELITNVNSNICDKNINNKTVNNKNVIYNNMHNIYILVRKAEM